MVDLAQQLIARQQGQFQPEDSEDRYESKLREIIAARLKGEGITPDEPPDERPDNVIDLMAALKASLAQEAKPGASAPGMSAQGASARPAARAKTGAKTGTAAKPAPSKRAKRKAS
jgi:DNA end-binding protein Ku